MFNVPFSIQDQHGNIHTNAVVVINQINYSCTDSSTSYLPSVYDAGNIEYITSDSPSRSLAFNAFVWKDAQAFADKKQPISLRDTNNTDWFNVPLTTVLTNHADRLAACNAYVLDTVLPSLAVEV